VLRDLVLKNRSIRRFDPAVTVERATLRELVDLARLSASASNLQPLRYVLSADPARNAAIFECLGWAGYLAGWIGPDENERPAAYIIILGDRAIAPRIDCDHGIAAQSILLGAAERGLGGCIIGSIQRERLRRALDIPEALDILLAIALGKPAETVVIEPVGPDGSIRYWRDEDGVHHVPKRALADVILD
jgi:nitroreductase